MMLITLTKGKFVQVDDSDFDYLNQWKWGFYHGYAARNQYLEYVDGKSKYKKIYMHRLIICPEDSIHVDHIDMNGLNNQRKNLRKATVSQNHMNRLSYKNSASIYKG